MIKHEVEPTTDSITITYAEYQRLLDDSLLLESLDAAGVDNWEGYDNAMLIYQEEKSR